mmetsp:Transcript_1545/g.3352  ORF Transcript_1545/g.3352 Transcript_1545/m.3352 type:complete len:303 (-) Transcript_1545:88-996(-)|eukprot:CAMPEP_0168780712 /NCGR_PEP_ID=MMETSP0725-20121227/8260_1 /TAXON_ID=265536 /ORGANISM="Amphiprora sp., Strain CCMP467" /LENGTH=302 /DNA_ID=CAMNT_0008830563 /DNA_START=282 /DNA_END=1190 /DNA_ORIENTATION=-
MKFTSPFFFFFPRTTKLQRIKKEPTTTDDEDNSSCSAMDVLAPLQQDPLGVVAMPPPPPQSILLSSRSSSSSGQRDRRRSKRKAVRFTEHDNRVVDTAGTTASSINDLHQQQWYSHQDYRQFYKNVVESLSSSPHCPASSLLLQRAYESCYAAKSDLEMDEVCDSVRQRLLPLYLNDQQQDQDDKPPVLGARRMGEEPTQRRTTRRQELAVVSNEKDAECCWVGLEVESHSVLFRDRDYRRLELWDTLIWMQNEQEDGDDDDSGGVQRANMIRYACETVSRTSRFWARSTALALQQELREQS